LTNGHRAQRQASSLIAPAPSPAPSYGPFPTFPLLPGHGWSSSSGKVAQRKRMIAPLANPRRRAKMRWPLYEIELTFDFLRRRRDAGVAGDLGFLLPASKDRRSPSWLAAAGPFRR